MAANGDGAGFANAKFRFEATRSNERPLAAKILEEATTLEEARTACQEAVVVSGERRLEPPMLVVQAAARQQKSSWPESIECYLGPTNSGKTWQSLEFLAERGAGCYAGPLRALAWEVREDLQERCAKKWPGVAPTVGLWTGEESVDIEDASILCCTAEVAPRTGDTLVLDEVHWCVDPNRGTAWTRLLMAARQGSFKHVRICGPVEATELMRNLFERHRASLDMRFTTRRSRLYFKGDVAAKDDTFAKCLLRIKEEHRRVCVVAFSRSAVLSLAGAAQAAGLTSSAVFGKLPPEARRKQLEAARAGKLDVIVTTDVIGHGINLPIDDIIFAETRKFDGEQRRDLAVWEAAQVAGRAGRGENEGRCWIMAQHGANANLVRMAVDLANGELISGDEDDDDAERRSDEPPAATPPAENSEDDENATSSKKKKKKKKASSEKILATSKAKNDPPIGLVVDHCVLSPDIDALRKLCPAGELSLTLLPNALRLWTDLLALRTQNEGEGEDSIVSLPEWVRGCNLAELCRRLEMLAFDKSLIPQDPRKALTCVDYWFLALLPVHEDNFAELARAAALSETVRDVENLDELKGEDLENEIRRLGDVIMAARRFPAIIAASDDDDQPLREAEAMYLDGSKRIGDQVQTCIELAFQCRECGKPKSAENKPSDAVCRKCYASMLRDRRHQRQQHQHQQQEDSQQHSTPPLLSRSSRHLQDSVTPHQHAPHYVPASPAQPGPHQPYYHPPHHPGPPMHHPHYVDPNLYFEHSDYPPYSQPLQSGKSAGRNLPPRGAPNVGYGHAGYARTPLRPPPPPRMYSSTPRDYPHHSPSTSRGYHQPAGGPRSEIHHYSPPPPPPPQHHRQKQSTSQPSSPSQTPPANNSTYSPYKGGRARGGRGGKGRGTGRRGTGRGTANETPTP